MLQKKWKILIQNWYLALNQFEIFCSNSKFNLLEKIKLTQRLLLTRISTFCTLFYLPCLLTIYLNTSIPAVKLCAAYLSTLNILY
jgi:hypothetical protein